MNVAMPDGYGLKELVFQVMGLFVELPLEKDPHRGKVVGFVTHKQVVCLALPILHKSSNDLHQRLITSIIDSLNSVLRFSNSSFKGLLSPTTEAYDSLSG